jgi:hypothetical protein
VSVTGEPIQLGDHELRAVEAARFDGVRELRAIVVALAALNLGELGRDRSSFSGACNPNGSFSLPRKGPARRIPGRSLIAASRKAA